MNLIGLDLGHATAQEAEHWLATLPPVPGLVACTHIVHGSGVVITLAAPSLDDIPLPEAMLSTVDDLAPGRAVIYPGVPSLRGVMAVAQLLAVSAIERIHMLGGPAAEEIDTRDFVRPQWMDGVLTLVCTPAPHGRIAPFEVPNPTPCCANH